MPQSGDSEKGTFWTKVFVIVFCAGILLMVALSRFNGNPDAAPSQPNASPGSKVISKGIKVPKGVSDDDLKKIQDEYNQHATERDLSSAAKGDAVAMNRVGQAYENGERVNRDMKEAAAWYRRAAEAGSTAGMVNLGRMYEQGLGGLPKDLDQAAVWYRKAGQADNTDSGGSAGHPEAIEAVKALQRLRR